MARPLRVDVEGGWYHITARGTERRSIFPDDSYCEHFLELLEEMVERYAVEVHAYCLVGNHYHLILRTPQANASSAIQWLNVSHSVWFNRKQERVGHVFQGRFKSVLIDGNGSWLLLASVYLHLNPVRISALGLGKRQNRAEAKGLREPSREEIQQRLDILRRYAWNSYRAYAGYVKKPDWLSTGHILRRGGGRQKYRKYVQSYVTRGSDPAEFDTLRGRVAIGAGAFLEKVRGMVERVSTEQPDRRFVSRVVDFDTIVRIVEKEKGERWKEFRDRRGDWGRDMVLYLARKRSGLTLRQIGEAAGGVDYKTISKAIGRFGARIDRDKTLALSVNKHLKTMSNVET